MPADIKGFLAQIKEGEFQVKVRKYANSSKTLIAVFLHDWLEIVDDLPHQLNDPVNPSLTLSELQVLRYASQIHPDAVTVFYSNFLAIPKSLKAADEELEQAHRNATSNYLSRYSDIWRQLDNILRADGGLSIPRAEDPDPISSSEFTFSKDQLMAIDDSYREIGGIRFLFRTVLHRSIVGKLGPIKARLGNTGSFSK